MSAKRRPSARSARPKTKAAAVRLERGALTIESPEGPPRRVPLWSGAVHYFRAPRESWRTLLEAARDLGITAIETYVPWQVHELGPGRFDFGQASPENDVGAFIDLVGELGLYAIVRPGPHINSEMTFFGLPERIVFDRSCQARSPRQAPVILGFPPRMFPVPSYASETFFAEVERWYGAVGAVLASRVFPFGPIVLLQVDNEAAFYFRDGTYDQDYHPDAIVGFRAWLRERYETEAELSRVHGDGARFDTVEPPIRFDVCGPDDGGEAHKIPKHLDWGSFRESMITAAIRRMKGQMEAVGLGGVPTIHNLPLGEMSAPLSLPALEGVVDAVGLDYYHARREHAVIVRRTLYLVGSSRLPMSPEMGAGAPYWFTPLSVEDSQYCLMTTLAYGLRGANLYMAVDRDRWYGAPIDSEGRPRAAAVALRRLLLGLRRTDFHELVRRAPVGIVVPREYLRLSRAAHTLGFISPVWLEAGGSSPVAFTSDEDLGLSRPIQVRFFALIEALSAALDRARVPFVLVDSEVLPERLVGLEVLISPSYDFAAPERWRLLTSFAARGGTVALGPALPTLDDTLRARPFALPKNAVLFSSDDDAAAETLVADLVRASPGLASAFSASRKGVEVTVHEDAAGVPRVVFVLHPGTDPAEVRIEGLGLPRGALVKDVLTERHHDVRAGTVRLTLRPQSVTMLEVVERLDDDPPKDVPSDDEDDAHEHAHGEERP